MPKGENAARQKWPFSGPQKQAKTSVTRLCVTLFRPLECAPFSGPLNASAQGLRKPCPCPSPAGPTQADVDPNLSLCSALASPPPASPIPSASPPPAACQRTRVHSCYASERCECIQITSTAVLIARLASSAATPPASAAAWRGPSSRRRITCCLGRPWTWGRSTPGPVQGRSRCRRPGQTSAAACRGAL